MYFFHLRQKSRYKLIATNVKIRAYSEVLYNSPISDKSLCIN